MEGLRVLARHDLDRKCTFAAEDSRDQINGSLSLITVSGSPGSESSHQVRQVSESMMLREVEDSRLAKDKTHSKASLTLAVITRETGGHICISKRAFLRFLALFRIDPYVLHLISFITAGFHHDPTPYESSYTYYFGGFTYLLTWSFEPCTMRTCGILLPWKSLWAKLDLDPVQDFVQVLRLYDRRLYTPFLLVFVMLIHLTRKADDLISYETAIIRQTEAANLHGQLPKIQVGIDQLSDFARVLEDSLGHLCDLLRHLDIAESLVDFIERRSQLITSHHQTPTDMHPNYDEDLVSFGSAFGVIRSQIDGSKSGINFFRERARNQYSVVRKPRIHPPYLCFPCLAHTPSLPFSANLPKHGLDFRPTHTRRRPHRHQASQSQLRSRRSGKTRRVLYENHRRHDNGVPSRNVLCGSLCCAVTKMGSTRECHPTRILGLLGVYDPDDGDGVCGVVVADEREISSTMEEEGLEPFIVGQNCYVERGQ